MPLNTMAVLFVYYCEPVVCCIYVSVCVCVGDNISSRLVVELNFHDRVENRRIFCVACALATGQRT